MDTRPRMLANRYRLETELGRGGMGTVWRAYDETLRRPVAIKEVRLPPELGQAQRHHLYQRTLREARTAAGLRHPNIVVVHDVVEEDDRPWIVMELVEARTLAEVIRSDGPLSPTRAADIGVQVLAALEAAHAADILHRDIKPSNILVETNGKAVLADFGIAKQGGPEAVTALTQSGVFIGTPTYAAPECIRGQKAQAASDLWSLGATLYEAVEGQPPFEGVTPMAVLAAILSEPPRMPLRAGALRKPILGLLKKDPAERYTAAQVGPMLTTGSTFARWRQRLSDPRLCRAIALTLLLVSVFAVVPSSGNQALGTRAPHTTPSSRAGASDNPPWLNSPGPSHTTSPDNPPWLDSPGPSHTISPLDAQYLQYSDNNFSAAIPHDWHVNQLDETSVRFENGSATASIRVDLLGTATLPDAIKKAQGTKTEYPSIFGEGPHTNTNTHPGQSGGTEWEFTYPVYSEGLHESHVIGTGYGRTTVLTLGGKYFLILTGGSNKSAVVAVLPQYYKLISTLRATT